LHGFGKRYRLRKDFNLPEVGLSLKLWRGEFEGKEAEWLRWCDADGKIIPTGAELALTEREARQQAEARVKEVEAKAEAESKARQSAEAEIEKLRAELRKQKKKSKK
jgi:hypothetical protein